MKALLLSAGFGTRLRPLTDSIPKCLVPVNGKPLLGYWLESLVQAGVTEILINTHYLADKVVEYIEGSDYKPYVTVVYEEVLLGTAGTLLKNRAFFENGPALLIHADNLSKFDMKGFIERHMNRPVGTEITMMTFDTDLPQTCGILEIDEIGIVRGFHEKVANPPGNLANGAVYIVEPGIFDFLEAKQKEVIDFSSEVIPFYIDRIYTYHNDLYHRDIGSPESYARAQQEFPLIQ